MAEVTTTISSKVSLQIIGEISSCFTEKFGIPRQAGMVPSATARLRLLPPFNRSEMVHGLDQFSHIWVHFLFHATIEEGWKATVRPPWLGGKKRMGVFASRSPHRPNHLGLSVVKLEAVSVSCGQVFLDLSGGDFLDGTPVVDIKPYLPYSDCLPSAVSGYAHGQTGSVKIDFNPEVLMFCHEYQERTGRNLQQLIEEMIRHDPRPASQKGRKKKFGMLLWGVNTQWSIEDDLVKVEQCSDVTVE
jgi:tRNA (adenine37-N6)-methyltransferase